MSNPKDEAAYARHILDRRVQKQAEAKRVSKMEQFLRDLVQWHDDAEHAHEDGDCDDGGFGKDMELRLRTVVAQIPYRTGS